MERKGRLKVFSYDADLNGTKVTRKAMVYLPHGYQKSEERYDVLYLMHGRGGSYRTWLGTPGKERTFKSILDEMITAGDIRPIIVVASGLAYEYGTDEMVMEGTAREIVRDLIPHIDRTYRTLPYRDHRAMAGFSMGGSLTWHMLRDYTEYFRYYLPMSMAMYYDKGGYSEAKSLKAAASIAAGISRAGFTEDDFFVFSASGEDDHKAEASQMQVEHLISQYDLFNKGNMVFRMWPSRWHRYTESFPYLHEGLKLFFK